MTRPDKKFASMDSFNIKLLFYFTIIIHVTLQDSSQEGIKSRVDNIIKSANDNRNYRALVLSNDLKVLLISDPTTDISAASVDVNVGSMSDPVELPGLAHFCEHMLFLGTEKYPQQNDFDMFISQNGGSSNAYTLADQTIYYFRINTDNLEGGLDRLAQFFIQPIFNESNVEREVRAVHSEFEMNLKNDYRRTLQLDRSSADKTHPYSGFSTGSIETLETIPKQKNINVRHELLKFYEKWYSANIITVSVLGKESLDSLEKMAVRMFSSVKNKNVKAPEWTKQPFNAEHFECKWYVLPIQNIRKMIITFPIPDLQKYFRSAPVKYLVYLLSQKGEGSLQISLQEKGWIDTMECGENQFARGFSFFNCHIDLTEEGLNHVDDIVTRLYQYINMIKREGPTEWIFNEYKNNQKISFRFQEKSSATKYVMNTGENLQKYPIEEILSAEQLIKEWKPDLINMILDQITPQNIRIKILAQVYENITTEVEPLYQTKFRKERIPVNVIEEWNNAGYNSDFKLPTKNEFIPTDFDLKTDNFVISKFPTVIKETSLMRVWFKQDAEFLLPKAFLTIHFTSPIAYINPVNSNSIYFFTQLFQEYLNKYLGAATSAGLEWRIKNTFYGINLTIGGYNSKQFILLKRIMDEMMNFKIDEKKFKIFKENEIRKLQNFNTGKPYVKAEHYMSAIILEKFYKNDEELKAIIPLTAQNVRDFLPQLFSKMHVDFLIYGNVREDEALKIASLIESKLKHTDNSKKENTIPLSSKDKLLYKAVNLKQGYDYLYEIEDKLDKSSATLVYYQVGLQTTELNMLLALFSQIIMEPCFTILRTIEQLGYKVMCNNMKTNGARGLVVNIQSEKNPQFVEGRIDNFMKTMELHIKNMSDLEFNKHKESVAARRSEKPKTMEEMSDNFWNEIFSQVYNFDRANIEVAYLKTITKDQILEFYQKFIKTGSTLRKKLSIHVTSTTVERTVLTDETNVTKKEGESKLILIKNIDTFKATQSLYPRLPPFIKQTASSSNREFHESLMYVYIITIIAMFFR